MNAKIPDLLEMMRQLVAIPSVSSVNPKFDQGNIGVVNLLAEWLKGLGFETEVMSVGGRKDKANLIATLGSGENGLVLSGHTDTVPYDKTSWSQDPFTLTEKAGLLYGLGTSDMKGFLAMIVEAASQIKANELREPLIILATADEESDMSGAKELVKQARPKARYALIGEPTENIPVRLHKGITMEGVKIIGKSGHSSNPEYGNSALEGMYRVMTVIRQWRDELQSNNRNEDFKVPVPTLNLGYIQGGDNPNRICADCELHFDLRPLPGMDLNELRQSIHQEIIAELADTGLEIEFKSLFPGIPAMETPAESELVIASEELAGNPAVAVNFATEGPFLNQLGMETVIMGPGEISQAHKPDEYLSLDRVKESQRVLSGLIRRFCINP